MPLWKENVLNKSKSPLLHERESHILITSISKKSLFTPTFWGQMESRSPVSWLWDLGLLSKCLLAVGRMMQLSCVLRGRRMWDGSQRPCRYKRKETGTMQWHLGGGWERFACVVPSWQIGGWIPCGVAVLSYKCARHPQKLFSSLAIGLCFKWGEGALAEQMLASASKSKIEIQIQI